MSRKHFLRISASWTSARFRQFAESIETLQENEDQAPDHFSKTNISSLPQPTCRAFPPLGRGSAFGVWLERRAKLEEDIVELDATRTTAKTLAMQLKSSRCAEDEECSAYTVLRNRVKPAKHSKRKVLASIVEDMRAVLRDTELTTHTELAEYRFRLNYHESAALVDAHARRCKLRTEAESARAEAVVQRTRFVDLEESKSRLIPELEELMTCSYQSSSNFDQAQRVSSSLQVESESGRPVLEQVGALFPRIPLPITSRKASKGMRDDQQSHYSPEGGGLGRCRTQELV